MGPSQTQIFIMLVISWVAVFSLGWQICESWQDIKKKKTA